MADKETPKNSECSNNPSSLPVGADCLKETLIKKCGCGFTKNPDGLCDGTHTTLIKPEPTFTA